jgi:hypothetical protein
LPDYQKVAGLSKSDGTLSIPEAATTTFPAQVHVKAT